MSRETSVSLFMWASFAMLSPGILVEEQRLHRYRHRAGGQPDPAEIDVIEVEQRNAVDDEDLALHAALLAQDRAQRLRDVGVEDQIERMPMRDRMRKSPAQAIGESGEALVGGDAFPAESHRGLVVPLLEVEGLEVSPDGGRELFRIDLIRERKIGLNDLQVASWQELARV